MCDRPEGSRRSPECPIATPVGTGEQQYSSPYKMRVLHVINGLETGGAEVMLLKLVQGMDGSRFTNAVVSMRGMGNIGPRIAQLGIPVFDLQMRGITDIAGLLSLRRIVREWQPDLIHGWMYNANMASLLAARCFGKAKLCWSVHASYLDLGLYQRGFRILFRCLRTLSGSPDAVLVVSHASRRWHEAIGYQPKRWLYIPIGVDPAKFRPDSAARAKVRSELGIPNDAPVVGFVANYMPEKDHRNFLAAVAVLQKRLPKVHAVIAGRGVDSNPDLLRLAAEFGIGSGLHLLGYQNDVAAVMNGFDVFSLSSYSESCPNVLLEAMACGIPCVTTDVGDAAYLVGDTGAVVPPRDPEALAAACMSLLQQEGRLLLGRSARERVQQVFSVHSVVRQYESSYTELCDAS